jgi:hypothetical protein
MDVLLLKRSRPRDLTARITDLTFGLYADVQFRDIGTPGGAIDAGLHRWSGCRFNLAVTRPIRHDRLSSPNDPTDRRVDRDWSPRAFEIPLAASLSIDPVDASSVTVVGGGW